MWAGTGWLTAATVAIAAAPTATAAETPVPLAPCQIATLHVQATTKGAEAVGAMRRAFPHAVVTATADGEQRRTTFKDGGRPLLSISAHQNDDMLIAVELFSPRFQLAPRAYPGASITQAQRALGQAELEVDPALETEETLTFADLDRRLGWTDAGCSVSLRAGPGHRVGLYRKGELDTHRFRQGAVIGSVTVTP